MALRQNLLPRITNCTPLVQYLACVNHPALCSIHRCGTRIPTHPAVPSMLIVHVLPWKVLLTTLAMKTLPKVGSQHMAVNRVFAHHSGAPVPQTLGCGVHMHLAGMPFTDVSTDTGSGANDPHPAGCAGRIPLTFIDIDHTATLACAEVEIIFVDPRPFNIDGTSTLGTSATWSLLSWGPINHDQRLRLVIDGVYAVLGRTEGG